jgi:hypothetical protein
MDRYEAVVRYIGTGDYVPRIEKYADGDLVLYAEAASRIADLEAQLAASEAKCADTYQDVLLAIRDAEYYRMQLSDERLKFSAALARAEEAEREKDELLLAVSALMKAFDDGVFVRDTSNDNRPDWAIRLFNPLRALAVLREASDAALRQEMGVRGDE